MNDVDNLNDSYCDWCNRYNLITTSFLKRDSDVLNNDILSSGIAKLCGDAPLFSCDAFSPLYEENSIFPKKYDPRMVTCGLCEDVYKIQEDSFSPHKLITNMCTSRLWGDNNNYYSEPVLAYLNLLEAQTNALAELQGIQHITSVASQVYSITSALDGHSEYIKELIAPSLMLDDLKTVAFDAHKSIFETGCIREGALDAINVASNMADRQISWASQLCKSTFSWVAAESLSESELTRPYVNVISFVQEEIDAAKRRNPDLSLSESLEQSTLIRILEKGKALIDKIVNINKLCERKGGEAPFKCTNASLAAAATIGGTYCRDREAFGRIIDCLYNVFYENLERIKKYVGDESVRTADVYKCVFRVKKIRTDYRHDYEHGSEREIRKQNHDIGESYCHYGGVAVLYRGEHFQSAQEKLYDEHDELVEHLRDIIESQEA